MRLSPAPQPQRSLAFDFGLKRIGLAAGDTLTATAAPRPAVAFTQSGPIGTRSGARCAPCIPGFSWSARRIMRTVAPARSRRLLVVSLTELEQRFGLPVNMVDERWSSLEANEALKARRASGERGGVCGGRISTVPRRQ